MSHNSYFQLFVCAVSFIGSFGSVVRADHGTVVSGTVIAIDPVNQIMRVHVIAVNGQFLFGNQQNIFVDYLVSPATVVVDSNNFFVSQANIVVGSQIRMQFAGPLATQIALVTSNIGLGVQAASYGNPNQRENRSCDHGSRFSYSQSYHAQFNPGLSSTNQNGPEHPGSRPSRPAPRNFVHGPANRPSPDWVR